MVVEKLKCFDMFGSTFKMNPQAKSSTYTTVCSGVFSLIAGILIFGISVFFFRRVVDTSSPLTSVNIIRKRRPPRLDLDKFSTASSFVLFNGSHFVDFKDYRKYYTLRASRIKMTRAEDGTLVYQRKPYQMVSCLKATGTSTKRIYELAVENVVQVVDYSAIFGKAIVCYDNDIEDWNVEGSFTNPPYVIQDHQIYPCSLEDPSECATVEELSQCQLIPVTTFTNAGYSKKRKPLDPSLDVDLTMTFSVVTKNRFNFFFKLNEIHDDYIDFVGKRKRFEFLDVQKIWTTVGTRLSQSIHCTEAQIDSGGCEPYIQAEFRSSYDTVLIQRSYHTFFDLFSQVGGFSDLILISIGFFCSWYNLYCYKRWFLGQIHNNSHFKTYEAKEEARTEFRKKNIYFKAKKYGTKNELVEPDSKKRFKKILGFLRISRINQKAQIVMKVLDPENNYSSLLQKLIFLRQMKPVSQASGQPFSSEQKHKTSDQTTQQLPVVLIQKIQKPMENKIPTPKPAFRKNDSEVGNQDLNKNPGLNHLKKVKPEKRDENKVSATSKATKNTLGIRIQKKFKKNRSSGVVISGSHMRLGRGYLQSRKFKRFKSNSKMFAIQEEEEGPAVRK